MNNPQFNNFLDKLNTLIFDHLLQPSTIVAVIGFYLQIKHPELSNKFDTIVNTWLFSKKG